MTLTILINVQLKRDSPSNEGLFYDFAYTAIKHISIKLNQSTAAYTIGVYYTVYKTYVVIYKDVFKINDLQQYLCTMDKAF